MLGTQSAMTSDALTQSLPALLVNSENAHEVQLFEQQLANLLCIIRVAILKTNMEDRLVEYIKENKLEAFRRAMKSHERFDLDATSCLHWAVLSVRMEMVEILLSCGADVNHPGLYNNQTPLYVATSVSGDERSELIKILLAAGANPNVGITKPVVEADSPQSLEPHPVKIEATPLIKLVSLGDKIGATLLVDAGADVNLVDADGYTPLTMAIERESKAMVKLLLDNGASIEVNGPSGRSAYEMTSESMKQILSAHRTPGKKTKHAKDKKGWFGGLFKGGDKPNDTTPSPKKMKDKSGAAATSTQLTPTPESAGKRSHTKQGNSNGTISDKTNRIIPNGNIHATTINGSNAITPAKALDLAPVLDSTPYTSPSKPGAASPFTPFGIATPQNDTREEYITVAEHSKQMSALEKRIYALERKFEVQNELLDTQAEQIAVLLNSKGKL